MTGRNETYGELCNRVEMSPDLADAQDVRQVIAHLRRYERKLSTQRREQMRTVGWWTLALLCLIVVASAGVIIHHDSSLEDIAETQAQHSQIQTDVCGATYDSAKAVCASLTLACGGNP